MEHCVGVSMLVWLELGIAVSAPAGSFRCDRLVRSSLASSMAGFINGGRLGSLPVWMADTVVSTVLDCVVHGQPLGLPLPTRVGVEAVRVGAYLAILQLKDQLHFVAGNLLVRDLGGHPALGGVWLPGPGADVVDVCHGGRCLLSLCVSQQGEYQGPRCSLSAVKKVQLAMGVRPLVSVGVSVRCRCSQRAGSMPNSRQPVVRVERCFQRSQSCWERGGRLFFGRATSHRQPPACCTSQQRPSTRGPSLSRRLAASWSRADAVSLACNLLPPACQNACKEKPSQPALSALLHLQPASDRPGRCCHPFIRPFLRAACCVQRETRIRHSCSHHAIPRPASRQGPGLLGWPYKNQRHLPECLAGTVLANVSYLGTAQGYAYLCPSAVSTLAGTLRQRLCITRYLASLLSNLRREQCFFSCKHIHRASMTLDSHGLTTAYDSPPWSTLR